MRALRVLAWVGIVALGGCASSDYTRLYHTEAIGPGLSPSAVEGLEHLGPTLIEQGGSYGVNFGVFAAHATRVELLLFDDPEAERPAWRFPMERRGDVWNLYVEGVGVGQRYGYVAWGPNWEYDPEWYPGSILGFKADVDAFGNRYNPNKLLTDPWAKAVHREHDWGRGMAASGPYRTDSTWGAAAKSVVVGNTYAWSEGEAAYWAAKEAGTPLHGPNELVMYEVHPKGFTADSASGVTHPGTFEAVGQMAPYLSDLGITAVELLPIHEKPSDGGYWGYNNLSFFSPELSYSARYAATGDPTTVLDEFKEMVERLHAEGVEVVIDVVYNHTGEGGLWRDHLFYGDLDGDSVSAEDGTCDPGDAIALDTQETATLLSYRGLDNASYYILANGNQAYWNGTGVGNACSANAAPMNRLILDSLRWYVEELHVDGFRFDLAAELTAGPDGSWMDPSSSLLQAIADDPVLQAHQTRIIAEPWAPAFWGVGQFPASTTRDDVGWGEWNPYFRDFWRDFFNTGVALNAGSNGYDAGATLLGTEGLYGANGRRPYHATNFITVHDGFTLYDLVSFDQKQNACGLLNSVCCSDACSSWCETNSGESHNRSRNWGDEATKRQIMRNLFTVLMISRGTPLILGGDEWMRSQYGNNNAWGPWADNQWNWFRWGEWKAVDAYERYRMHDFVRELIAFRKEHPQAFAPSAYGEGLPVSWKNPDNSEANGGTWGGQSLMVHYYNDGSSDAREVLVLLNGASSGVEYTLPTGRTWGRVVDTQAYFDTPDYFTDATPEQAYLSANITRETPEIVEGRYTVQPHSIVLLEQQ